MSKIPSILEMLEAGVHFGHQSNKWHPKMAPFIFTQRNGVHIIDLEKTQSFLADALEFLKQTAAQGKTVLFVSTKDQAKSIVKKYAEEAGMPYITERWLGGLLTNFHEIGALIKRYNKLKAQRDNGELEKYTKKEQTRIAKELAKKERYLKGVEKLERQPEAIFIIDLKREKTAFREAKKTGIKIVALCDTNINPDSVDYLIPSNDDATKTIELMVGKAAEAIKEGLELAKTMPVPATPKDAQREPAKEQAPEQPKEPPATSKSRISTIFSE